MKRNIYISAAIALIPLIGACTLSGHGTGLAGPTGDRPQIANAQAGNVNADVASAPQQQRVGKLFTGTVGSAKVEMDIKREGDSLTGSYFYRKSGSANRLMLKGKIASDGNFTMQESDAAGKQTGEFKGKWQENANESGVSLEGEWLKPGQKSGGQGFYAFEQMIDFKTTQIATREMKDAIKAKRAEITAEYPELSGNANAAGFNQAAKATVMKAIDGFKKEMAELTAEDIKNLPKEANNYIEVGYSIEYADEDLISVNFSLDTYEGGAHGNHASETLTYDLKNGREVKLADLFQPGAKYLDTVAAYAMRDLKGRKDPETGENMGLAQDIFEDGAKPTAENYENWNITKKGLLFTFPPYQVAAYAYGPQSVIVPYSALKDIARADGALAKTKR